MMPAAGITSGTASVVSPIGEYADEILFCVS